MSLATLIAACQAEIDVHRADGVMPSLRSLLDALATLGTNTQQAACSIDIGGSLTVYAAQNGFVGPAVHNGAGSWTLTLAAALPARKLITTGLLSAGNVSISVTIVDPTHLTVRTFDNGAGGAATDVSFWLNIGAVA